MRAAAVNRARSAIIAHGAGTSPRRRLARSPLSGLAAELAAVPAPAAAWCARRRRPSIRPAVWSLLKGNLCLAGALLKIAGLKAHAFA